MICLASFSSGTFQSTLHCNWRACMILSSCLGQSDVLVACSYSVGMPWRDLLRTWLAGSPLHGLAIHVRVRTVEVI